MIDFEKDIIPFKKRIERIAFWYVRDYDTVQDIVQIVLIKLWEKRNSIYKWKDLTALISTIARNTCVDELRKIARYRKSGKDEEIKDEKLTINTIIPEEILRWLNDIDKAILKMKYEEWFTLADIANKLSVNKNTIRTRHRRILKKMKRNDLLKTCI